MKKLFIFAVAVIVASCGNKHSAPQTKSDSTAVAEVSVSNDVDVIETQAPEMIKDFYMKHVFDMSAEFEGVTEEVINKYCTKKLAKKLADDYEYEGGGYAMWDFRSGAQDGESDVQEIINIESLGGGKFKVYFNDMGNKGSRTIAIILVGDNILFDEISE